MLPAGAVIPFDFGVVPSTLGEDGDPLDILVLMDTPAFPGGVVPLRLIGVIEAEQTEHGRIERNDRLLAVAANSATHRPSGATRVRPVRNESLTDRELITLTCQHDRRAPLGDDSEVDIKLRANGEGGHTAK